MQLENLQQTRIKRHSQEQAAAHRHDRLHRSWELPDCNSGEAMQAKGRSADQRNDIFSFGCVLYEMLTGRQTFHDETVAETLAAILMREPDLNALPPNLHPKVEELIRRCLAKKSVSPDGTLLFTAYPAGAARLWMLSPGTGQKPMPLTAADIIRFGHLMESSFFTQQTRWEGRRKSSQWMSEHSRISSSARRRRYSERNRVEPCSRRL
jgi:serine/threonine protein kinase